MKRGEVPGKFCVKYMQDTWMDPNLNLNFHYIYGLI